MENLLSRFAVAAVAGVATLGGVTAPHAHAEAPIVSSAPTEQLRQQLSALFFVATLPSSFASSFVAPQCTLLDTRGC